MNANEIADELDGRLDHVAANMLRKQTLEIQALHQILKYEGIGVSQEYLDECVADLKKAKEK